MKSIDKFVRLLGISIALLRGQIFLFPRLNTRLLRIYGKVKVRGPKNNIQVGRRVTFLGDADLICGWDAPDGKIVLGDGVVLETACYLNAHGGTISIGSNAFVGVRTVIQGKGNVSIGRDSMLGPYVQVYSSDHQTKLSEVYSAQPELTAPVTIGPNTWVGAGSILLRGTELVAGTVVAAGSVVRIKTDRPSLVARSDGLARVVRNLSAGECGV